MHWSKKIAQDVINAHPKVKEYVVASGISPSGSIHIGNFREFVTNYYVARALQMMGKRVRMVFSWDNFDRLRKVPLNVRAAVGDTFDKYIGCALADIPNPFGDGTYAKYFQIEFLGALNALRMNEVPIEFLQQNEKYKDGDYTDYIVYAIQNRERIYDILMSFKTQGSTDDDRKSYYPIQVYCETCGRDSTKILSACVSHGNKCIDYQCKCDDTVRTMDIKKSNNIKLAWKIDWPMRWKYEGVHFEAAGPDHQTEGGSYQVASKIAREIFGIEPPVTCTYGWIGVKGLSSDKMSSSSGQNITPQTCLRIYEPEIIRYLFAKYDNTAPFEFGFDDTITRHYTEFDRGVQRYRSNDGTDYSREEYELTVFELCLFAHITPTEKIGFNTLATVAPLANFDAGIISKMLDADVCTDRIQKVEYWLKNYCPEKIYNLRENFNIEFYNTLSTDEKATVESLAKFLKQQADEKQIQEHLYQIINNAELSKKENLAAQQRYFKIFYQLLFGRDDGPRLYLYLAVADRSQISKLLTKV
jgi:lysyl-tRNA synthetase class 1